MSSNHLTLHNTEADRPPGSILRAPGFLNDAGVPWEMMASILYNTVSPKA